MLGDFGGKSIDKMPLVDTVTPFNVQLCGFYRRSFAYFTMKERLPIIITKVIDYLTRDRDTIAAEYGKNALEEVKQVIGYLSKLKNEIQTNKKLKNLEVKGTDVDKWNYFINNIDDPYYFTATWLFAECYVYRRIREAFELTDSLNCFDPFSVQKHVAFEQSLEAMCLIADNQMDELSHSILDKVHFIRLLKMTLWGNKCDLSLSAGENVNLCINPLAMVDLYESNLIVDNCNAIYDDLVKNAQNNIPNIIDYVCDNAGYELFCDLCFADVLIAKKLASKIRFHIKAIPWFVSDVVMKDFDWMVDEMANVKFNKNLKSKDGTINVLTSENINKLGAKWRGYVDNGMWSFQADEFWTLPHEFCKMQKYDKKLYETLGEASTIFFKGDLNYRKLMGEMNWPPTTTFETALQGFFPSPLVAVRTVKADLISGMPPGKMEELNKLNDQWMETGDYGLIQYCTNKSALPKTDS